MKYSIIGYECGVGGIVPGCKEGPRVLRERGLVELVADYADSVSDLGNASGEPDENQIKTFQSSMSEAERQLNNYPKVLFF